MTDADLIRASMTDPDAFLVLLERHGAAIKRYVTRRVGTSHAEDLVSETFTAAFDGRGRYDPARPDALPWLLGIATNLLRAHWRAERRQLEAAGRLAGLERTAANGEPSSGDGFERAHVAEALRRLGRRDRDALLLFAWGELTYAEVALATGVPVGTVRSRIARARRKLAPLLRGAEADRDGIRPVICDAGGHDG